ncbi:MAG: TonB-dependent receptor [Bacteroidales bacterium]|nr:MAG: TonB-dependent receptor [Bacteroidales bacterium]
MKENRLLILFLTGLFLFFNMAISSGQGFTVKGTISDATTGEGLPGVNIIEKGTTNGTVTDQDGNYSIEVADQSAELEFSYVGYLTESVQVGNQQEINFTMVEDIMKLEELVVIGYGTQRKSDLTGSVSVVNTENLEKISTNNIAKVLQGQTPGVQVFGAGEPGALPRVQIRGVGTFGETEPLYVIDGVPIASPTKNNMSGPSVEFEDHAPGYGLDAPTGGIADFNPNDIESVQILKDASAAAIYGARGANGVIIITTKRGQAGDIKINYEGSFGFQNVAKRMELANRVQFQEINNLGYLNDDVPVVAPANDPDHPAFIDSIDTDWQKEFFTTGYITDHSLSFSGGTENSTYYASLNYFDQTGTVAGPGPRFTKYGAQLNLDQKKGRLKFGQSLSYSFSDQIRFTSSRWNNIMTELVIAIPTVPVYDDNNIGGYGGGTNDHRQIAGNPVAFNNLREVSFKRHRFFGVVYGELEILKSLSYRINLSYDRSEWFNKEFVPLYNVGNRHTSETPFLSEWRGENPTMIMEHLLNFNKEIGNHSIAAVVGYTAQKDHIEDLYGHAEGYTEPYLKVLNGVPSGQSSLNTRTEHTMLSYLGRINYSFADRYLVTASMRRDYSSNFGPENKYGDFPSFALGWKVHNESFFDVPFVSQLKLRGGWGKIGNENIESYLYETTVNNAVNYMLDGVLTSGTIQTYAIDPSIRWEERVTSYAGFDLALLRNKIEISAEYYHNTANDILMGFPIPISSGALGWEIRQANGASMTNKGIEISASYRKLEGDFHYQLSGSITTLKNEVTDIGPIDLPITTGTSRTEVGGEMGQLYTWVFEGIFQDTSEINSVGPTNAAFNPNKHAFQHASTEPGDIMFKDVNGRDSNGELTGEPDGIINDDDRIFVGNVTPKFTYGFNASADYKGLDLSIFIQGIYGNKVYNGLYAAMSGLGFGNYSVETYENYWREDRPSTKWPMPSINDHNSNTRACDRFVQDGSYLRIQNVQLGYTLPANVISMVPGIDKFRIYLQAQNLFTFTKMITYDPDFINDGLFNRGYAGGSFPSPRTFMFGVSVTL